MKQRRLNIPLPPLRERAQRAESPFYRPVPHSNSYSNPDGGYDVTARREQHEVSAYRQWQRKLRAERKRVTRKWMRRGFPRRTSQAIAGIEVLDVPL